MRDQHWESTIVSKSHKGYRKRLFSKGLTFGRILVRRKQLLIILLSKDSNYHAKDN